MTPTFKKFGIPLIVVILGGAILGTTWWVNGAEVEDLWLYLFAAFFVLYAGYELFSGLSKHYKDQ
jgi:hypothetical protein